MNKKQLASTIWESANKMRSKIEANEYKDYILGFMFYKFLSYKEVERLTKIDGWAVEDLPYLSEEHADAVSHCQANLGYFIAYDNLFSTWLSKGKDFDVSNVRDALSAFSRLISDKCKKLFENIFKTLETGLSKLGDSSGSQTKAISELIQLIQKIPMDGKQDYDVLGFIYEYLISMFAANAGKKAGEFYTPHEVSLLMSEIVADHLKDRESIQIYDPTSGSGSLLINIGHSVAKRMRNKNNIKYFAQELKENTYNLTRMNLVMRGILPDNICTRNGDTLEEDWPYFDESDPNKTYEPLYVDAVVSNPPYSQAWDPSDKDSDPRYKRYGLAPKTKADYAFLMNSRFEKYLKALQSDAPAEVIEQTLNELHKTFASLSQEEQKFANIFLRDVERGDAKIEEGKTLQDYIAEYQVNAKNDQIHRFAVALGVDEGKLRTIMALHVTESNINEYGRFNALVETVDKAVAKHYFETTEGQPVPSFKLSMKINAILRKFILSDGFEV